MPAPLSLRVVGVIRSPFVEAAGTPIQPCYAQGAEGKVQVDEAFAAALDDIEGFERVWLIYWMDRVKGFRPHVVPYRDTQEHGLFATRSPCRPNPIGMSVVRLLRREGQVLHVADIDVLDGTPLLDIKPYVPDFDSHPGSKAGWFDAAGENRIVADKRFHHDPKWAVLDRTKCTSCGICVSSCPLHAIEEPMNFCCAKCVKYCSTMEVPCEPARIGICAERCDGCGLCVPCCPNEAIHLEPAST